MKVTICIGSSCHLKGSRQIVEIIRAGIAEHKLSKKIELSGTFCMNNCKNGVCVTVDGKEYSVSPDTADTFFEKEILSKFRQ